MKRRELVVSTDLIIDVAALLLFLLSLFNVYLVLVFYVFIMLSCFYGIDKCLKTLVLISTRGILSDAVAVSTSRFYLLKWIIIFAASGLLLLFSYSCKENIRSAPEEALL